MRISVSVIIFILSVGCLPVLILILEAFFSRKRKNCSVCKDKGEYYVRPFLTKVKGTWISCECKQQNCTCSSWDGYCCCQK